MKYIKKFESNNKIFHEGEYVKLKRSAIINLLQDIKINGQEFDSNHLKLTYDDLKNKDFFIEFVDYNYHSVDDHNEELPYYVKNVDINDDFDWGWSCASTIRRLTKDEIKELELKINIRKYNL